MKKISLLFICCLYSQMTTPVHALTTLLFFKLPLIVAAQNVDRLEGKVCTTREQATGSDEHKGESFLRQQSGQFNSKMLSSLERRLGAQITFLDTEARAF